MPLAVRLVGRYLAETGEGASVYLAWLAATPLDALNQGARRQESVPLLLERSLAEVLARLAGYYTALAETESTQGLAGYRRLDPARGHLLRVLEACAAQEQWEAVPSLVWAVDGYLNVQGYWTERVQALETGVQAAEALEHRRDEGAFLGNLGGAYHRLGQVQADKNHPSAIGYYEQALAIAREIGDRRGEGNRLGSLGLAYADLGQVEEAIEYYEQALAIAREIGNRLSEGIHLHNLGDLYKDQGDTSRARQYLREALAIFEEVKSPYAEISRGVLAEVEEEV